MQPLEPTAATLHARRFPGVVRASSALLGVVLVVALGWSWYRTTVPHDPLIAPDLTFQGVGLAAKPGQTILMAGRLDATHGKSAVMDASHVPAYDGLGIRVLTTSAPPQSAGAEILGGDESLFPSAALESIAGRHLNPPRRGVSPTQWWLPIIVSIHIRHAGCWRITNLPVSYHVGETHFTHTTGTLTLHTPGQKGC